MKIALTGYERAKQQLAQLGTGAKAVGEKLGAIGRAASVGFAAASATALSLVRAADPTRFTIFEQQLKITAILIGRLFIPVLKQLIQIVNNVNVALSQMTRGQMDGASGWGKWALIVSGVGAALAFVAKVVMLVADGIGTLYGLVAPLVRGLATLIRTAGKILPLGRIVRLLTLAFLALHHEGGRLGEMFDRLKRAALPVLEQMWEIGKQLWEIFAEVAGIVGDMVDEIFGAAGSGLLDVFEELLPLITEGLGLVRDMLVAISEALRDVIGVVRDAKAIYTVLKDKKAKDVPGAVAQGVGRAAVNDGADALKSLTGGRFEETIDSLRDFVKDDLIGGKEDEDRMLEVREQMDTGAGDYSRGAGGSFDDGDDPFRPLMPASRVQSFGVEDAFKRAQEGATFDPGKASDMIIKLLASNGKLTEDVVRNTARPSGAALAF